MKFVTTVVSLALALGLLSTHTVFAGAPSVVTPGAFMGDFNGDGRQDVLIFDSGTGALYVYVTASGIAQGAVNVDVAESGLLTTLPAGVSVKGVGDFNNDGRADVLVQDASGNLPVLVNDNAVSAGSPVALDAAKTGFIANPPAGPAGFEVLGAADANDDGNADVYVIDGGGNVFTYITSAAEGGEPSLDGTIGGSPIGLPAGWTMSVVGDLNGDGLSDMMASNTASTGTGNRIYNFITAAGGVTVDGAASGNPGEVPTGWGCCAAGNLTTGNASNDFAVVNESGSPGAIYVYALNDDGISVDVGASAASVVLPAGWDVAGLGDFNNDGIADTLAANTDGSLLVFLNSGPGTVTGAAFLTQMPAGWSTPDFQGMSANENEVAAQSAGSCDYVNQFSSELECKAYSGSAWTATSAAASCVAGAPGALSGTWSASTQCAVDPTLGTCSVPDPLGEGMEYVLQIGGGDPLDCTTAAVNICAGLLAGTFTPSSICAGP